MIEHVENEGEKYVEGRTKIKSKVKMVVQNHLKNLIASKW